MKPEGIRPVQRSLDHYKFCIHSEPGVGKTVLAGTSPKALIIRPPQDNTISAAVVGTTAEELTVNSWREMDDLLEYMQHEGHREYEWGWLDSISLFQDVGLDDVYEDMIVRKGPVKGKERKAFGPDKGEYGVNMHRLMKWIRHMTALPMHFGVTAHTELLTLKNGDEKLMPWVQGKQMSEKLVGYMHLVGYMTVAKKGGEEVRVLRTRKTSDIYAKDQFNAFGGKIINPTIPEMMAIIQAKVPQSDTAKKTARKRSVKEKKSA